MATPTGWLKIYRKMLDDPNYLRKPFDKTHAWLDILLTVNFEKRVLNIKGTAVTLKPGQMVFGYRQLANRWGWSVDKVRRYFRTLNKTGSATLTSTPNGTLLTVVKWASYQGDKYSERDTDKYTDEYTDKYDKKKDKNVKEEKKTARRSGSYLAQKRAREDEELAAWAKEGGQ